jgi:proteasome assembly chaperone (PAC2) family protein
MMNDLFTLEKDVVKPDIPTFMIAGFTQWANAGNVSSGIPEYLIEKLDARKIGHMHKSDFYLFQLPGSQYMFRPPVKYKEGYEEDYQEEPINDFYYTEISGKGLVIFIGTEPNQHEDVYANIILNVAQELCVKRIIIPSGVGDEVPFAKERRVGCAYSLAPMYKELENYAVSFSNYKGTATIGIAISHYSKERNIETITLTAFTPSYQISVIIPTDKRAIYDILRRVRYMFGIDLDLSDLEKENTKQISDFERALKRLYRNNPELESQVLKYMETIEERFKETRFEELTKIPDVFLKELDDSL